jgi:septal ring-binding cell division protein DamX
LRPVSIGVAVLIVAALLVLAGRFLWPEDEGALVANFQENRVFQSEQILTSPQQQTVTPGNDDSLRSQEVIVDDSTELYIPAEPALTVDEESDLETLTVEEPVQPQLSERFVSPREPEEVGSVTEQESDSLRSDILPLPEAVLVSESDEQVMEGSALVPSEPEEAVVDRALNDGTPATVNVPAEPSGLIDQRMAATRAWLQTIPDQGYTVQLLSVSRSQDFVLLDFLELMSAQELLDQSYICSLSVNEGNVPNRLVVYGEFQGLSLARQFINSLPDEVAQYAPFVRNLNDISCTNQL